MKITVNTDSALWNSLNDPEGQGGYQKYRDCQRG